MKKCPKCKLTKTLSEFPKDKTKKDGHGGYCKPCGVKKTAEWKEKQRTNGKWGEYAQKYARQKGLARYGVTVEWYERKLVEQNGRCAVCGKRGEELRPHYLTKKPVRLAVDHSHVTGKNRGLLCETCNWLVGTVEKNKNLIPSVLHYLDRHR